MHCIGSPENRVVVPLWNYTERTWCPTDQHKITFTFIFCSFSTVHCSGGKEAAKPRIELLVTCGLVQSAHDARGKHSWEESHKICGRKAKRVAKQMINLWLTKNVLLTLVFVSSCLSIFVDGRSGNSGFRPNVQRTASSIIVHKSYIFYEPIGILQP